MHNAPLTPPASPPQSYYTGSHCVPPTPESRIGKILGESLELKGILGTGAYGVVYSAFDHFTKIWHAVKALSRYTANGEPLDRRQREFQSREIQLHYAASAHPNIVSMSNIVDDKDCIYVVLEYCQEGDLFSNITEKGRYVGNDALVQKAFLQILNAVEHCHRLGIYHRDLKPENILVSNSGSNVLLADFGLATTDVESDDHGCGSTFYMSPECLDQSSRTPSYQCAPNDIWSLGVILVNLTCGRNPWKRASSMDPTYDAFTRNHRYLKTILPLSDEVIDILGMIFDPRPEDRITIGELKDRIIACRFFSAQPAQSATPPRSPCASPIYQSPSSPVSDTGSFSDDCLSLVSDDSDLDSLSDSDSLVDPASPVSDCDSGYHSMDCEEPIEVIAPQAQRPEFQFIKQQYVLPSQEFSFPQKPVAHSPYMAASNPWLQAWFSNGYPYGRAQHAPQVYRPTHYTHHPYSHFQHASDTYYY